MGIERHACQRDYVFRGTSLGCEATRQVHPNYVLFPYRMLIALHRETMTPHHRLQSYFGYSFESYCTSSRPGSREPLSSDIRHPYGWGGDVDTNVQWCAVVKTKLGNDRLVIGGEVDCVRGAFLIYGFVNDRINGNYREVYG